MRCSLLLPAGGAPLHLDPIGPVLTTELQLDWPGRRWAISVPAVVDTGCPVDIVASAGLAGALRSSIRPARIDTLDWGGRLETEVYEVDALLGGWRKVELHAPLEPFDETLLGLRALLKANLCIRGEDGSAYWGRLPGVPDPREFLVREDGETEYEKAVPSVSSRTRKKQSP